MSCTIFVNWETFDVLHDEVRQSVIGCASIEKASDIWIIEVGKNLPFVTEMTKHRVGVHATFDQLDCDLLLVLLIRALGQIDGAHSAPANLTNDAIGTN